RPPPGGATRGGAPVDDGDRGLSGSGARAGGRASRRRDPAGARAPDRGVDGRAAGEGGRAVAVDVLRTLHREGGRRADGVRARLAGGAGEGPGGGGGGQRRRGGGGGGVRLGEHVQRRVHAPRRGAAESVRAVRAASPLTPPPPTSASSLVPLSLDDEYL